MYCILVCDDEKDIVSALEIYLRSDGYEVFTAYNGREALEIMDREEIQLVLMDIMMPEMDGIETMCKIREKSNVPVILLTAKSEDTDKVLGLTVGADDYLTKPFSVEELLARLRVTQRRLLLLKLTRQMQLTRLLQLLLQRFLRFSFLTILLRRVTTLKQTSLLTRTL